MTAPRIDAVRNEIRHASSLLQLLAGQLDDLHVLAYDRSASTGGDKVRGGSRDYALDNHGDRRARDLYEQIAKDLRHTINDLVGSIKSVRGYLTSGSGGGRRDASADATTDEVLAALDAQRRRHQRGEYQPTPLTPQPAVVSQTEWQVECEALRSAVRKITTDFLSDHQHCVSTTVDHRGQRRKITHRYQTKLLTPRERDAWRRANQSVSERDDAQAV